MNKTTTARLRWDTGISFGDLAKSMVDFFTREGLQLHVFRSDNHTGIFSLRFGTGLECSDTPWLDDPMLKPGFLRARWVVLHKDGSEWGDFLYDWEHNPGSTLQNLGAKVFVLKLYMDGVFHKYRPNQDEFLEMVEKYHLLKNLFLFLNCDELIGVEQTYVHAVDTPNLDPTHRDKDFRFAKKGTQVLIRQMEERNNWPPSQWEWSKEDSAIYADEPELNQSN